MKLHKYSLLQLALFYSIVFLIISIIIEFLFALNTKNEISEIITFMTSKTYIIKKVVPAFVFGFIMAFVLKKRLKK